MIPDKFFVFMMVGVIVLGFVVVFISANRRVKKFKKIFGTNPGNGEADTQENQPRINAVIREYRRRVSQIDARRPKDNPLSEAYDRWEEERALALMALDDARALARTFGYFMETDPE